MRALTRCLPAVLAVALFGSASGRLNAAEVGTDNASVPAYANGWSSDSDGTAAGNGFGPWRLFVQPDGTQGAKFAVENSTTLSNPGADINSDGKAFSLSAKRSGATTMEAAAFRDFQGGPLSVGQTFTIDLAVNFRNGFKGIDVRSGSEEAQNRANLFTLNVGGDDYVVSNALTGNGSIGNEYNSKTKIRVEFSQTTTSGGTWRVTRGEKSTTGTYSGQATGIKLYCSGTDGNAEDKLFFNNLSIAE